MIEIVNKEDCCGCTACILICPLSCIFMKKDEEGFLYPSVDLPKCTSCESCLKVCPITNNKKKTKDVSSELYACKNRQDEVRSKSSSGGIFSLIADYIIDDNGVVFAVYLNDKNVVCHDYTESASDLNRFRGSKYVQSYLGETFLKVKKFISEGREVLFCGTPCQIAGLINCFGDKPTNLVTLDFVCHGVPSPRVFSDYIKWLEKKYRSKIQKISFRDQRLGWELWGMNVQFFNGNTYQENLHFDPFLKGFLKDLYLRPSCHNCVFKYPNHFSDITLADYWGVQYAHPELWDSTGVSLAVINTELGKKIFNYLSPEMFYTSTSIHKAKLYNPCIVKSVLPHENRFEFFESLGTKPVVSLIRQYCNMGKFDKLFWKMRNLIVTLLKKIFKI